MKSTTKTFWHNLSGTCTDEHQFTWLPSIWFLPWTFWPFEDIRNFSLKSFHTWQLFNKIKIVSHFFSYERKTMMKIFNLQNNEPFYNLIRLLHMAWPIKCFQTGSNEFEKVWKVYKHAHFEKSLWIRKGWRGKRKNVLF